MIAISDTQLAEIYSRKWRPEPGVYAAPAAIATWDGQTLLTAATGEPLDTEVAACVPRLARHLSAREIAPRSEPTIAALGEDYPAATAGLDFWRPVVVQSAFDARLSICRACDLWNEAGRAGRGSCASVRASCACRRLWVAGERCPDGKWPV